MYVGLDLFHDRNVFTPTSMQAEQFVLDLSCPFNWRNSQLQKVAVSTEAPTFLGHTKSFAM